MLLTSESQVHLSLFFFSSKTPHTLRTCDGKFTTFFFYESAHAVVLTIGGDEIDVDAVFQQHLNHLDCGVARKKHRVSEIRFKIIRQVRMQC
jgi:hypothetical protein